MVKYSTAHNNVRRVPGAEQPGGVVSLPMCSVITPTWQRHELLLNRCIPSVQAQTYRYVEHVIVSDGPDPELERKVSLVQFAGHPVRYLELPSPHPGGNRYGGAARRAGIKAARGDLIAYIDDDDSLRPGHVQAHVKALTASPAAAWSYSVMASYTRSGPWTEIGWGPPMGGQIGTPMIVHRRELLEHGTWGPPSATEDWELVQRWMAAGQEYVHVPEVTIDVWPSVYWG